MKMNIVILALASILSTHVSASTVHDRSNQLDNMTTSDHARDTHVFKFNHTNKDKGPKQSAFDHASNKYAFKFNKTNKGKDQKKPDIDLANYFNSHQVFQIDEHRNFHAYNKGYRGLEIATVYSHSQKHVSSVPVPAAVWLFVSGLVGMVSITRRKKPRSQ